mgnify:CR=1 FL=1
MELPSAEAHSNSPLLKALPLLNVAHHLGQKDCNSVLRYAHLAPTSLIAAVDVINKINGDGNIDTAYQIGKTDSRRASGTARGKYPEKVTKPKQIS